MSRRKKYSIEKTSQTSQASRPGFGVTSVIPLILIIFAYVNVSVGSLFYPLDFDLGWHLRYGQDVVENHFISSVNTYSADMAGYHWRNSSWLSDVLRYIIFKYSSFQGLMIAGIVTMVVTFYVFARAAKFSWWEATLIFPILVYMETPLTSASFRAQLLSFTGMGVVMWILASYQAGNRKALWWLLPLFLVWGNLHGGFILSTFYLIGWTILFVASKVIVEKSMSLPQALKIHALPLLAVTALSTLATFVNPWGPELYLDHLSFLNKGNPSQFIVEWKPLLEAPGLLRSHVLFGFILLAGVATLVWKKQLKAMLPLAVAVIFLYFAAYFSRRYAWTMYFMAMPLLVPFAKILKPKNTMIAHGIALLVSIVFFAFIWMQHLNGFSFQGMNWDLYCSFSGCSPPSADYVVKNLKDRTLYTTYDWGGWLIWNYPQIKPIVDGRMPTWQDDKGYNAFINYVTYEQNRAEIDGSKYDVVYLSPGKRALFEHMFELVSLGKWKIAYKDSYAFVFVRSRLPSEYME